MPFEVSYQELYCEKQCGSDFFAVVQISPLIIRPRRFYQSRGSSLGLGEVM